MTMDFDEDKHPRDDHGRFSGGGLGAWAGKHAKEAGIAASLGVREASPKEFHTAFEAAFKDNPYTAFVSHYTEDQLKDMKCYLSKDGKAGVAVHDHGDGRVEGTALFSRSETKGAGVAMLAHAVLQGGVNYVECYGPHLDAVYSGLGFKEQTRDPFNKEYAAPNWDYKRFGTPDYVTMKLELGR